MAMTDPPRGPQPRPPFPSTDPATGMPPAERPDWREEVMTASGLNVLAGVWLIIAPWVLVYSTRDPVWNDVIFGVIVAFLALIRISGAYREAWLSFVNLAIGVWIFIAAFTIDVSGVASGNDIVMGIIVFLLAAWSIAATNDGMRARRGGGAGRAPSPAEAVPPAAGAPAARRRRVR